MITYAYDLYIVKKKKNKIDKLLFLNIYNDNECSLDLSRESMASSSLSILVMVLLLLLFENPSKTSLLSPNHLHEHEKMHINVHINMCLFKSMLSNKSNLKFT